MRHIAEALERGTIDGAIARFAERAWARRTAPRLVKPLAWRQGAAVVAIGGATLGGSGKTPLAIACARALAEGGLRVAIVGHAYAARPGGARVVQPGDDVDLVGDEALVCARACPELPVVVAPTRQEALDLALRLAEVAILDGVHQTSPRATLALLAVDPHEPWGAGACPPRGDLRAPAAVLAALADRIVPVVSTSRGAFRGSALVPWRALRGLRIGLASALARPARLLRLLELHGVRPHVVRTFCDHARASVAPSSAVELWLTTAKCAASLRLPPAAPHAVLEHCVTLDGPTLEALAHLRRLTPTQLGSYARRTA